MSVIFEPVNALLVPLPPFALGLAGLPVPPEPTVAV